MKVAVHISDCDGICSAALVLRKYPHAEIDFHSNQSILSAQEPYDIVIDLPKPLNAKVNIDHHYTNLERLKKEGRLDNKDIIDPKAPSAASLLINYLGLDNDLIAKELVEMANLTDTGNFTEELLKLDKIIKASQGDTNFLYSLAKALAEKGKKVFEDIKVQEKWEKIQGEYNKLRESLQKLAGSVVITDFMIVDERMVIPYYLAKDMAFYLFERGAKVVALFYDDPGLNESYRVKCSLRVAKDYTFDARMIAEKFGGGGHTKAAGIPFKDVILALTNIVGEFANLSPNGQVTYLRIRKEHLRD